MRVYNFLFFLSISLFSKYAPAQNTDINILKQINVHRNTSFDGSMHLISNTEAYIGVGLPLSICAIGLSQHDTKLLKKGLNMSLALAMTSVKTYALKRIVDRPRPAQTYPFIQALENETKHSFPSGHTSNAFCTATSLSMNFKKWYIVVPAYVWAGSVAYSRMHLGVHYPSDVLAGAVLGAGSAWVTYKLQERFHKKYAAKYKPGLP
ncbi:MAG: phosphatase PAP2 family protein [Bacteroidetes bacterium]|nr:phosphatase PAP2 family protein [Bacteroidota bacterium]